MEEIHRIRREVPFGWLAALLAALRGRRAKLHRPTENRFADRALRLTAAT